MKAKHVFEFEKTGDPKKSLNIGYNMKIFLICSECNDYDEVPYYVIVAHIIDEVRHLAKKNYGSEGPEVWETAPITEVGIYTGEETKPFILGDTNLYD